MKSTAPTQLPEVNFSDHGDIRYLHLGTEWVQGSMRLDDPFAIDPVKIREVRVLRTVVGGREVFVHETHE